MRGEPVLHFISSLLFFSLCVIFEKGLMFSPYTVSHKLRSPSWLKTIFSSVKQIGSLSLCKNLELIVNVGVCILKHGNLKYFLFSLHFYLIGILHVHCNTLGKYKVNHSEISSSCLLCHCKDIIPKAS